MLKQFCLFVLTSVLPASATPFGAAGDIYNLGTLGGTSSVGNGINNAGQVAGSSQIAGDTANHAFRYTGTGGAGGFMEDLGTLGGSSSYGYGINDAGFVVGGATRSPGDGAEFYASLWQIDGDSTAIDLDAWLDATTPILGAHWTLIEARGINNYGLMTGYGSYDDGPGGMSDGIRAFILDASSVVPEPSA